MEISDHIKLINFVKEHVGQKFSLGENCCSSIGLKIIDMFFNENNYEEIVKGKFHDKKTLLKFQKENENFKDFLIRKGAKEIQKGFEQAGDFILVKKRTYYACHIFVGPGVLSSHEKTGVRLFDLNDIDPDYKVYRLTWEQQ